MYLVPLNCMHKLVKMVIFLLLVFYQIKKKKKEKEV